MTTATATKKTTKAPDVGGLREQRDELLARRDELIAEVRLVTALVDPHVHNAPESTRPQRLRAAARRPEVERDLRLCQADLEEVETALKAAQEAERDRLRQHYHREKAPAVQRLSKALEAAAQANAELAEIEEREVAAIGGWSRSLTAWPELLEATPTVATRLSNWRSFCEAEGLLVVEVEVGEED